MGLTLPIQARGTIACGLDAATRAAWEDGGRLELVLPVAGAARHPVTNGSCHRFVLLAKLKYTKRFSCSTRLGLQCTSLLLDCSYVGIS